MPLVSPDSSTLMLLGLSGPLVAELVIPLELPTPVAGLSACMLRWVAGSVRPEAALIKKKINITAKYNEQPTFAAENVHDSLNAVSIEPFVCFVMLCCTACWHIFMVLLKER